MESNCAGLILHRQKPPLTRRSLVYYCSGVHKPAVGIGFRGVVAQFALAANRAEKFIRLSTRAPIVAFQAPPSGSAQRT